MTHAMWKKLFWYGWKKPPHSNVKPFYWNCSLLYFHSFNLWHFPLSVKKHCSQQNELPEYWLKVSRQPESIYKLYLFHTCAQRVFLKLRGEVGRPCQTEDVALQHIPAHLVKERAAKLHRNLQPTRGKPRRGVYKLYVTCGKMVELKILWAKKIFCIF